MAHGSVLAASLHAGCVGHWVHQGAFEMRVIVDGESKPRLNWWPGSGAWMLVGDAGQRMELEQRLRDALAHRP